MSNYLQQHDQAILATSHKDALNQSLFGYRSLVPSGTEPVAFMLTNDYSQRIWPKSKQSMVLKGAIRDRIHAKQFLDRFMPGIRVEEINNALCQSIKDRFEHVARVCPPLVVAYFQGHSGDDTSLLRYITGDRNEDSTLEGFTAEKLIKMFSKLSTMSMIITDFCNSGNIHRLRFRLIVLPGGGSYWRETQEWSHDNAVNPKYRITSPMVHISASLDSQSAYETGERGGFLTDSLAKAPSKILPEFLSHLRQGVGHNLKDAKVHPRRPLDQSAAQLPQIYCTCKLPLDDPEIFSKIYSGMLKQF